jgi:hypothetical protein
MCVQMGLRLLHVQQLPGDAKLVMMETNNVITQHRKVGETLVKVHLSDYICLSIIADLSAAFTHR